jgi:hypothetical protein
MLKKFALLIVVFSLFFSHYKYANAAIITVNNKGEVIWNVLSSSDELALSTPKKSDLEVREVQGDKDTDKSILLKKEDQKMVMNVGENKKLDITNVSSDVVELEERGNVKKINISTKDGKFVIEEAGVTALTEYPININPKENELSLVTSSGAIFLSVLPMEAAETALRSRFISKLIDKNIEIKEKDLGVLTYSVKGERVLNLLNIASFNIPVTTLVSTTTGEILLVDQPKWLSVIGFLFT